MEDSFSKLIDIISEKFGVTKSLITPEAKLAEDLNLSSLEVTDLIAQVAQEFKFQIPEDTNINSISTVSDLVGMIEQCSDEL